MGAKGARRATEAPQNKRGARPLPNAVELNRNPKKKGKRSMTEPEPVTTDILPDPTLDSKSFKKLLMDRLRAQGGSSAVDTKQ